MEKHDNATEPKLLAADPARYGSDYSLHVIEVYKLYVQMTDNTSARRQSANSFFLSANTAVVAVAGLAGSGLSVIASSTVSFSGVLLCLVWYLLIRTYRNLIRIKFDLIYEVEDLLPVKPYTAEWGRLRGGQRYLAFSDIEGAVPWVFLALHVLTQAMPFFWLPA